MRVRNKYPRGDKFKDQELETWEENMNEFLWFDAFFPGLY